MQVIFYFFLQLIYYALHISAFYIEAYNNSPVAILSLYLVWTILNSHISYFVQWNLRPGWRWDEKILYIR